MLNVCSYIKNRNVTNHNISFLVVEILFICLNMGRSIQSQTSIHLLQYQVVKDSDVSIVIELHFK